MAKFQREFTDIVFKEFRKGMTSAKAKKQIKLMAEDLNQFQIDRILMGRDIDNRIFRKLTRAYTKIKKRFIKGQVGKNKSLRRLLGKRVNKYRAKNTPNYIRLTGQLINALRVRVKAFRVTGSGKGISYTIEFFILKSQRKKAGWVIRAGRKFFGLGRVPSLKKKQKKIINFRLNKIFK